MSQASVYSMRISDENLPTNPPSPMLERYLASNPSVLSEKLLSRNQPKQNEHRQLLQAQLAELGRAINNSGSKPKSKAKGS